MKCVNHPDRDATAQCYKCMKLLCDECRILSKDGTKAICRPCLAILKKPPVTEQPEKPTQPEQPVYSLPHTITPPVQRQALEVKEIKPKKKKKWWLIAVAVVVILIIAGTVSPSDSEDDPAETNDTADIGSNVAETTNSQVPAYDYEITDIDALFKEYEDNAVAADKKYNGKYIKVTGCFKDSGKDVFDNYYITIGGMKDITWDYFQCYFKNNSELEKVLNYKSGDSVALIGKVGDQMLSITLKDCVLAE